jgi:exodeoxyribonuclease VII small subunit
MAKKVTFEDNMTRLGQIVSELEKGDIPLEKAVELYGEGVRLSAECRKQLDSAQIKITEDGGESPSED